jgi:alpha-glucosidase
LSVYRRLIALRASTPALQVGTLELQPPTDADLVAYTREADGQCVLVALNLGRAGLPWRLPESSTGTGWRLLLTTATSRSADAVFVDGSIAILEPDEGLILERMS